jgi:hypothetical protein
MEVNDDTMQFGELKNITLMEANELKRKQHCDQTSARMKQWQTKLKPLHDVIDTPCCKRLCVSHEIEVPQLLNLRKLVLENGDQVNRKRFVRLHF